MNQHVRRVISDDAVDGFEITRQQVKLKKISDIKS